MVCKQLSPSQLLARMRDHAQEVLPPAGLNVRFQVPADLPDPALAPDLLHNLYLIYKEALHNAVKHARGATLVTIGLTHEAGQLCLTVRDNAPGPAPVARSGGRGLANMRQRAEAMGGALHFVAEATGFGVVACLPG